MIEEYDNMESEFSDKILSLEQKVAIETLSDSILVDINARLKRIIRRLGIKRDLEKFTVEIVGIQLKIDVDEEFVRERLAEHGIKDLGNDNLGYYA